MTERKLRFDVVSIHGVPRSGTSWLGQVFDSHPGVVYRHQPLFAYRFKDRLNAQSTRDEIYRFLRELYQVDADDFILDVNRRRSCSAFWQNAIKDAEPRLLVMKMVRYHHLISMFLRQIDEVKIIGIVRHPCAVINSWLQAPKEFRAGWDPLEEWRRAPSKNAGRIEEFNGFEKWKEVAHMFLELERAYPRSFCISRYEDLIRVPVAEIERLFAFVGIEMSDQTLAFLQLTHSQHDPDPYSIVKDPTLHSRWQTELTPVIAEGILQEVRGTELRRFLV